MLVQYLARPADPGFREWVLAPMACAAGLAIIATYPAGRPAAWPVVIVANLLTVGSADQVYRGLRRFEGRSARLTATELAFYGVAMAAFLWFLLVDYSVPARVAVNGFAMAFASARATIIARRRMDGGLRGTAAFLSLALGATAAAHLVRATAALLAFRTDQLVPVGHRVGVETSMLLVAAILSTGGFLGLLMLALRKTQDDLAGALARVKRLEGIIPICMHCFRVRTDQDSWDRIEKYLADHTDAALSHGVCPACLEKHYPAFPEAGPGRRG